MAATPARNTMEQYFEITGMHCDGCVKRVTKALEPLADEVSVTLEPPRAILQVDAPLAPEAVQAALTAIGDYQARPLAG
jgi:Cu+-exporting ATPase